MKNSLKKKAMSLMNQEIRVSMRGLNLIFMGLSKKHFKRSGEIRL